MEAAFNGCSISSCWRPSALAAHLCFHSPYLLFGCVWSSKSDRHIVSYSEQSFNANPPGVGGSIVIQICVSAGRCYLTPLYQTTVQIVRDVAALKFIGSPFLPRCVTHCCNKVASVSSCEQCPRVNCSTEVFCPSLTVGKSRTSVGWKGNVRLLVMSSKFLLELRKSEIIKATVVSCC